MNGILICWSCSQIYEMFRTFKGLITYLHPQLKSVIEKTNSYIRRIQDTSISLPVQKWLSTRQLKLISLS